MDVSVKELREQPGYYIKLAEAGSEINITSNRKRRVRLVPIADLDTSQHGKHFEKEEEQGFLFGIWANRTELEDVPAYVRALREGRSF